MDTSNIVDKLEEALRSFLRNTERESSWERGVRTGSTQS
jgi:hypothetical protein